jgi:CBS domain-containing protein
MHAIPTVRDVMSTTYFTLPPDMDVFEAIDLLARKQANGAPVVDADHNLIGILTEKDCIRLLSRATYGTTISGTVREFMSEVKLAVDANMDLFSVAQEFLQSNFPALPVMESGRLVGRVTRQGMLRGILQLQRSIQSHQRREDHQRDNIRNPSSIDAIGQLVSSQNRDQLAQVFSKRYTGK